MEPRAFVRLAVGGLGLRIPVAAKASRAGVHAASSPCFCEIRLPHFPVQTVPISLVSPTAPGDPDANNTVASFYLDEPCLEKLLLPSCMRRATPCLEVVVFTGRQKLGTFRLPVTLEWAEGKPILLHSGWTCVGKGKSERGRPGAELHLSVKVEADPRYQFQFDGETALSPQIVQVCGNTKQPIFSCKFSRDRSSRSRVGQSDMCCTNGWSSSSTGEKDKERKERKGWLVMIHDLSGSPVAAASMVTPFVPLAGSDHVSRSNPGAWLILRPEPPGMDNWIPWGRLEAWRERGGKSLGCRFQLMAGGGGVTGVGSGFLMAETLLSAQKGGEFSIDTGCVRPEVSPPTSPVESPRRDSPKGSGEFSFNLGLPVVGGFVMSCAVRGEHKYSKPLVQLAMRHVACVEDAAVFMALAAAVDLSVDACLPFSRKLRKELSQSALPA